jgi:hypothetical protein
MVDSMCLAAINIVDGLVVESLSGAGEAIVAAVETCISSILSVADLFAVVFVAGGAIVVPSLGSHGSDMAFGAAVLNAIITAFMAAMFALRVFLCCFFLLLHLPCPGPGMLRLSERLRDWCWFCVTGSVVLVTGSCGTRAGD